MSRDGSECRIVCNEPTSSAPRAWRPSAQCCLIFAWVNDENSLRTYGSKTDAYKVFKGMLDDGNPPDDWDALHKEASDAKAVARLEKASPPNP